MNYKVYIAFVLPLFLALGCASSKERERPSTTPDFGTPMMSMAPAEKESVKTFRIGVRKYKEGKHTQALEHFSEIIASFPQSSLVDNAIFYSGETYFAQGNYDQSAKFFQTILEDFPTSPLYNTAKLHLAMSYIKSENLKESLQILKSLLSGSLDETQKREVYVLLAENYQGFNEPLIAISWYMEAMKVSQTEESLVAVKDSVKEIVQAYLSKNQLSEVIQQYQYSFPSGCAEFQLAKIYFHEKNFKEAAFILDQLVKRQPKHEYELQAKELLEKINNRMTSETKTIGCILPMTGKYGVYGEKILHGIELAADVFNAALHETPVKLIIKDSRGNPEEAANAVQELISEEDVICIIGPLLGITAEAAAQKAEELKIPMIALSQKSSIAQIGEYIFQNSLTPEMQTRAIVDYAIEILGLNRFAILYPDNRYGNTFLNLFWDEVLNRGGEIMNAESYHEDQSDFQDEMKKLGGVYYIEKKEEEEIENLEFDEEGLTEEESDPILDFDALFIPDYHDKVGLILPQLAYYDIVGIQLLGTSGWNSPQLIKMAGEYVEGAIFLDGFFKNSPYPFVQEFVRDFKRTFDEEPTILEAQAFDSANIVLDILQNKGVESRKELKEELLKTDNYPGVSGAISFDDSGNPNKILFHLTVQGRSIIQLR